MAQVIGLGSLVLDRPLDRDYPAGSPIREVASADDYTVWMQEAGQLLME